jgi:hypothetical protein
MLAEIESGYLNGTTPDPGPIHSIISKVPPNY